MTELSGKPVLVTGAGGFIGSHLTARLVREGARVQAFARYNSRNDAGALEWIPGTIRDEVEVLFGDLRSIEFVTRAIEGTEYVFHLGALIAIPYSYASPRDYFETNVLGTLNVAQAALRSGVERIVHTSTSEVYGSAQFVPITEQHPLNPQSPYAASKVAADKLMDSYHRSFDLPVTVIRPFNTFGPHQSARAVIPTIISQALAGGPLKLGALEPRRDLTYVDDTVSGFLAAATASEIVGMTIQLGTGHDVSIGDIVRLVGEILGRPLEVHRDETRVRPAKSEVSRLASSPRLAAELMGWTPRVELREGLERTVGWVEQHLGRYSTSEYVV